MEEEFKIPMTPERKLQGIDAFLEGVLSHFPNIQVLQAITADQLMLLADQKLHIWYDHPVIVEFMTHKRQVEGVNIHEESADKFVQLLIEQRQALQLILGKKSEDQQEE